MALHGCRQFVLRGVALSCLTNAIHAGVDLACRALSDAPFPGSRYDLAAMYPATMVGVRQGLFVVEVKSIWPRSVGRHTCHKGDHNGPRWRQPLRTPNSRPSPDCALQVARMKLKPLVIVHQDVTVKQNQALHTPPITLGKCAWQEGHLVAGAARSRADRPVGDLSEVDTR